MGSGATLEAIESLYRSRYPDFLRTAIAITDSREAGRDAVHDAFAAALRKRRSFRGDGTLEAWIWPMVVRSAIKSRRPRAEVSEDGEADQVWTDRSSQGDDETRRAVAALPERQRLMLFLRYYGDLDYKTIAEATGIRVGTVGAELHAAHAALRSRLKEAVSG